MRLSVSKYCAVNPYPADIFERLTDILAEMALKDLKHYPQLPSNLRIDRVGGQENTVLLSNTAQTLSDQQGEQTHVL